MISLKYKNKFIIVAINDYSLRGSFAKILKPVQNNKKGAHRHIDISTFPHFNSSLKLYLFPKIIDNCPFYIKRSQG